MNRKFMTGRIIFPNIPPNHPMDSSIVFLCLLPEITNLILKVFSRNPHFSGLFVGLIKYYHQVQAEIDRLSTNERFKVAPAVVNNFNVKPIPSVSQSPTRESFKIVRNSRPKPWLNLKESQQSPIMPFFMNETARIEREPAMDGLLRKVDHISKVLKTPFYDSLQKKDQEIEDEIRKRIRSSTARSEPLPPLPSEAIRLVHSLCCFHLVS